MKSLCQTKKIKYPEKKHLRDLKLQYLLQQRLEIRSFTGKWRNCPSGEIVLYREQSMRANIGEDDSVRVHIPKSRREGDNIFYRKPWNIYLTQSP